MSLILFAQISEIGHQRRIIIGGCFLLPLIQGENSRFKALASIVISRHHRSPAHYHPKPVLQVLCSGFLIAPVTFISDTGSCNGWLDMRKWAHTAILLSGVSESTSCIIIMPLTPLAGSCRATERIHVHDRHHSASTRNWFIWTVSPQRACGCMHYAARCRKVSRLVSIC